MDATAPPHPEFVPRQTPRPVREKLAALIKEARERARRRRRRLAVAGALAATAAIVTFGGFFGHGGGGPAAKGDAQTEQVSLPPSSTRASGPIANGALTLVSDGGIDAVGAFGAPGPIFNCTNEKGCYSITSVAWSPNGQWLAFGASTIHIVSRYNGLHVYNPSSRRDLQLSAADAFQLSWSHDGSKLAYLAPFSFPREPGSIYIRDVNSSEPAKLLETGTVGLDTSPTWSPDGRRIAFATRILVRGLTGHWSVSTIALDGTQRRAITRHGSSPAWSPDGRLIAYRGPCGHIRLVTPKGKRLTPAAANRCGEIGVAGAPAWSPDGSSIAMTTRSGTYVMTRAGRHLRRWTNESGLGGYGARPAWQPVPKRRNAGS